MPATPIYGLRYPQLTDPVDIPDDLHNLATDVESAIRTNSKVLAGAKGDGKIITNAAITAGQSTLTGTGFTPTDAGKGILVVGAGQPWNDRGAWTQGITYAVGDLVHQSGWLWVAWRIPETAIFDRNDWIPAYRAVRSLEATILSVTGGVATLSVPAGTTVSGATAYYGTDDTATFQAACDALYSAGGGDLLVPNPTGSFYMVRQVFVRAGTRLLIEQGCTFRTTVPGQRYDACFILGSNQSAPYSGWEEGPAIVGTSWYVDHTGKDPLTNVKGVIVTNARHFTVEGARGRNLVDGNLVSLYSFDNAHPCQDGQVRRIRSEGGGYGWGAVQVDTVSGLIVEDVWSDSGRALNIETDDPTGKVAERIVANRVVLDARDPAIANFALGLTSHTSAIRDVRVEGIRATGGGGGIAVSGGIDGVGFLDRISIEDATIDGGGQGIWLSTNDQKFEDFIVKRMRVSGCNYVNPWNGIAFPGIQFCPGMTFEDCNSDDGAGVGFGNIFFDTAHSSIGGPMPARFKRSRARHNTLYGWQNLGLQRIALEECEASDLAILNQLIPLTAYDAQIQATGGWQSGSGGGAISRDTTLFSRPVVKMTANGTSTQMTARYGGGLMSQIFPVSPTKTYLWHCYGFPDAAAPIRTLNAALWYWDINGTALPQSLNSPNTYMRPFEIQGKWVYASVVNTPPATAAYASPIAQWLTSSGNMTNGEIHYMIPLGFGEVSGASKQTYAIDASAGTELALANCRLVAHPSGRIHGTPVIREVQSADLSA